MNHREFVSIVFQHMMETIGKTKYAIGPDANMVWIYDYMRYLKDPEASEIDVLFPDTHPPVIDEGIAKRNGNSDSENYENASTTICLLLFVGGIRQSEVRSLVLVLPLNPPLPSALSL